MDKNLAIGTDIGGSHIVCAAINLQTGKILRNTLTSRAVDNHALAGTIISVWAKALAEVISKVSIEKIRGIGFAMPGPFDYVNGISRMQMQGVAKYENLYGLNIADAIKNSLELPNGFIIRFINDASAFAIGEAWTGSAANFNRSVSVTFGTGFGSAFINNKIPIVEGSEVPKLGCVYHLPYKEGIVDDYFSTRWFVGKYKSLTGKEINGVKELAKLASKDKIARSLFIEFGHDVAVFLVPWLKKFKAEILVIGGNISFAYNLFGDVFESVLKKENCTCKVAISKLKEKSSLIGSAHLLDNDFWKSIQTVLPLM